MDYRVKIGLLFFFGVPIGVALTLPLHLNPIVTIASGFAILLYGVNLTLLKPKFQIGKHSLQ